MSRLSQDIAQLEDDLESAREYAYRMDKLCDEQARRIEDLEAAYNWVVAHHPDIITAYGAVQRMEN